MNRQLRHNAVLKIAYFINQYPKVSHTFIRREILALERQGVEISRIALRGWRESLPDPQDADEQRRTKYVLRRGIWGLILPTMRRFLAAPWRFLRVLQCALRLSRTTDHRTLHHLVCVAEACRVLIWCREARVAHVHAHFGTNSAEVALYAHRLGGPRYSFTVHGPDEFFTPLGLAQKIRHAAFVVAISSFGRSQLYLRSAVADWRKIRVVHCGIEAEFFAETDAVAPDSPAAPRLVCVGRLCEAKGQMLLVEAVERLRSQGVNLQLVLAGDGPMRAEIDQAIAAQALGDRIRITGWISSDQVRRELCAARALVLPSFAEGLPVVIMEAMALRRPVLCTYVAGIPELVRDPETGWLFPAGSVDALAAAITDCLARPPAELRRRGEAGQRRVRERHSIDVAAAKLACLFRTALD